MPTAWHAWPVRDLLANGEVVVVETEDDAYLGTAEVQDGHLVVRSGHRGHPVVLLLSEVLSVIPAQGHPDVES